MGRTNMIIMGIKLMNMNIVLFKNNLSHCVRYIYILYVSRNITCIYTEVLHRCDLLGTKQC